MKEEVRDNHSEKILSYFYNSLNRDKNIFETMASTIIGFDENGKLDNSYVKLIINTKYRSCLRTTNEGHRKTYDKLYENIDKLYQKNDLPFCNYNKNNTSSKDILERLIELPSNYQKHYEFCHIWGYSRNPWLNNAYWNTYFIPYYWAYLTDKNKGGDFGNDFSKYLKKTIISNKFVKEKIIQYNRDFYSYFTENQNIKILEEYMKEPESYGNNSKVNMNYILEQLVLININDGIEKRLFNFDDNNLLVINPDIKDNLNEYGVNDL